MSMLLLLAGAVPLAGLVFILLIGRRRRTSKGEVRTPAPGSPDSPMFGTPTKPHRKH
jgi:hypothetical protein